ncbi:hypothetical protein [Aestuariivirga sp.]|uniref:hypothetical protein n=1 Tax=Aestuariivirga sp. TaxID=2650926 RepID=UPI003BAB537F
MPAFVLAVGFARLAGFALDDGAALDVDLEAGLDAGFAVEVAFTFEAGFAFAEEAALLVAEVFFAAGLALFGAGLVLADLAPAAGFLAAVFLAGAFSGLVLGSGNVSGSRARHVAVGGGTTVFNVKGSAAPFKGRCSVGGRVARLKA